MGQWPNLFGFAQIHGLCSGKLQDIRQIASASLGHALRLLFTSFRVRSDDGVYCDSSCILGLWILGLQLISGEAGDAEVSAQVEQVERA